MQLVVGRIGRAHGITGEVAVVPHSDDPDLRFVTGTVLQTDPAERGPLQITDCRWHSGRLLVRFDGVADRTAAEALRGTALLVDSAQLPDLPDEDDYYDHQLVGLAAVLVDGSGLGEVEAVVHGSGPDLLSVRRPDGAETLVPFVREIVPQVDLAGGRVVIDPPEGLLDL